MIELPVCRWRGDQFQPGRWVCNSVKLLTPLGVTAAHCHRCPYKDHEKAVKDGGPLRGVKLLRADRCRHLGKRTEFKQGCGGLTCRHECDLNLPAVPAGFCQTCPGYEQERGAGWLS